MIKSAVTRLSRMPLRLVSGYSQATPVSMFLRGFTLVPMALVIKSLPVMLGETKVEKVTPFNGHGETHSLSSGSWSS